MRKITSKITLCFATGIFLLSLIALAALPVQADDYSWTGGDGNWSDGANWDPASVPGSGDSASVEQDGANVIYDYNYYATNPLGYLSVDFGSTLSQSDNVLNVTGDTEIGYFGTGTFNLTGGNHATGNLSIGPMGSGSYYNTGGLNEVIGDLYLGYYHEDGQSATYDLSDTGSLICSGSEYVGFGGNGSFYQSGGENTSQGDLVLGDGEVASGSYELHDGILDVYGAEIIGRDGAGTFLQDGGEHYVSGGYQIWEAPWDPDWKQYAGLVLGQNAGSSGTFTLTGGTLDVANATIVGGEGAGTFNLGSRDEDTGEVSGDGIHTTGDLYVGYMTTGEGSIGRYNLNSGTLNVGGFTVVGGKDYNPGPGVGEFNQYGGEHDTGGLFLGDTPGSIGTYNLYDGTLLTAWDVIGGGGMGIFNQYGGTHTAWPDWQPLEVGGSETGEGYYNLYDGELCAQGGEIIGNFGTGHFFQSGGSNTTNGDLNIGADSVATGTYDLVGGTLDVAGAERIGVLGSGGFTQFEGTTHTVGVALVLGNDYGSQGTYDMSGGELNVGQFDEWGNPLYDGSTIVGNGGYGEFNQSGGLHRISADLNLGQVPGASGTYNLSEDGELIVYRNEHIGVDGWGYFYQSGWTNHTVTGDLVLGNGVDSYGEFDLIDDGFLTVTGPTEDDSSRNVFVGMNGSGYFYQGGNTNFDITGDLFLAFNPDSYGEFSLSDSAALNVQGPNETDPYRSVCVGTNSTGIFSQSGSSTLDVSGAVVLGGGPGAYGFYTMDGGTLNTNFLQIGQGGYGDFSQYSGVVNVTQIEDPWVCGGVNLGQALGSTGNYYLLGNGVLNAHDILVGADGEGLFVQDGEDTEVNVTGGVILAGNTSGTGVGTYDLWSGSLSSYYTDGGSWGTGTFNQYGGIHTTGWVNIGGAYDPDTGVQGNGVYNLNDGVLDVAHSTAVGSSGIGQFNQNGGTHTISGGYGALRIGSSSSGIGVYNLNDGALNVTFEEYIGENGTGDFNQEGGIHTLSGAMYVGLNSGGSGNYHMTAGKLTATDHITLGSGAGSTGTFTLSDSGEVEAGYMNVGRNGTGTFTQSGGTNTLAGSLTIAVNPVSTGGTAQGTYNMEGGTLTAANIVNNDSFNYKGGTLNVSNNIINNGTFKVTNNPGAEYNCTFTNNGAYISDPSHNTFKGDLVIGMDGYLQGGAGDEFYIYGELLTNSTKNLDWNTQNALLAFLGSTSHDFYLTGEDLGGSGLSGYNNNFAWDTLDLTGEDLHLFDGNSSNTGTALYVNALLGAEIEGATISNIFGGESLSLYYLASDSRNGYLGGMTFSLAGGGYLAPSAVPIPPSVLLFTSGVFCLVGIRRWKHKG